MGWDFLGGPVVKTSCFQCRGLGFNPWLRTNILHAYGMAKNLGKKKYEKNYLKKKKKMDCSRYQKKELGAHSS